MQRNATSQKLVCTTTEKLPWSQIALSSFCTFSFNREATRSWEGSPQRSPFCILRGPVVYLQLEIHRHQRRTLLRGFFAKIIRGGQFEKSVPLATHGR